MSFIMFPAVTEFESRLPVYLAGVGSRHSQEHVIRPNGYPFLQWIQCRNGSGELIMDGRKITVNKNQAMLIFPNVPHEYYSISATWEVDWITISGFAAEQILHSAGISKSKVLFVSEPELFLLRSEKLLEMAKSYSSFSSPEYSKIIYSLLMDILAYTATEKLDFMSNQYTKLKPVLDYIEANYSKPIVLEDLSKSAGLTPEYLCTLFKKTTGIRIFEYINNIRIKNSKEMILKFKDLPLKDIARSCGYDDISYFCSIFKKQEKLTPGEFRRLHGV